MRLQRLVGNDAVVRLIKQNAVPSVQRAILAIDGATDNQDAKDITKNCLMNLKTKKQVRVAGAKTPKFHPASDARGVVFGPGSAQMVKNNAWAHIANRGLSSSESLYLLGHGGDNRVAGLSPDELAELLRDSFDRLPDGMAPYTGKIKLIACYSDSLKMDDMPIVDAGSGAQITKTFAESTAESVRSRRTAKFSPQSVDGVAGISWADEETGRITGFDVTDETALNPLDWVYSDPVVAPLWYAALKEKDPKTRKQRMEKILQDAHRTKGVTAPTRVFGKGEAGTATTAPKQGAKGRYLV
jgi:hypothetical protein